MPSSSEYKLSHSLHGHEDDVKAVLFADASTVISASRDASVRVWRLEHPAQEPSCTIALQGKDFVNSLAYLRPRTEYPHGLFFAGSRDGIVEARSPAASLADPAEALLVGHAGNVCALDVSPEGGFLLSGSWDCSAKLWRLGRWEAEVTFEGHEASVWAVLAYDSNTVITASADKTIRVWSTDGRSIRTIAGSQDVVRALCRLPPGHPSGGHFASAGNDGVIRLWTLQGQQVGTLEGHTNFIYSLTALPTGELVSSGEDRTVRIWKGTACVQTITHPAISVWSVAACAETGDVATGASDRGARVFSRDPSRQADATAQRRFEGSVQDFAIPKQQLGDVNKEQLPGPDFLQQKLGTKDGQVQMIREANDSVSAYTWAASSQTWVNVGTVVDSVGSSGRKTEYLGQDYDYVFDVDVEDGKPPLRLPYNLNQNPYQVAQKFVADNELPISYLDQVTQFIINNTQGASLSRTSDPTSQPQPGTTSEAAPPAAPKILPQKTYVTITTANHQVIGRKVREINSSLEAEGLKDVTLNPTGLDIVSGLIEELGEHDALPDSEGLDIGLQLVARMATRWPVANRIPGLDLLRLLAAATPRTATADYAGADLIDLLLGSGVFDAADLRANQAMLAVRVLANLFVTEAGQALVLKHADAVAKLLAALTDAAQAMVPPNRNLVIALATVLINYAVYATSDARRHDATLADHRLQLLAPIAAIVAPHHDSEAVYRALVALGTLLWSPDAQLRTAVRDVYDLPAKMDRVLAADAGREPRVRNVVAEILSALS
ncbi:hypothetical protein KEM52_003176 [Ascosphaera acerosa]|nr:hypothetical protein KEM52_003176 [Ascosphaera acerosa]